MVTRDHPTRSRLFWFHPKLMDYRLPFFKLMSQEYHIRFFFQQKADIPHHLDCDYGARGIVTAGILDKIPMRDWRVLVHEIREADVFISSFVWSSYTLGGLVIAKVFRKKIIVWEELTNWKSNLKNRLKMGLCRIIVRSVDAFFVMGEIHREALRRLGAHPEVIFVTNEYPGYCYSVMQPHEIALPIGTDKAIILFMGRLVEIKGVEYLLRGFALTEDFQPNAALLIAGDGPLKDHLEILARELGIKNIHFLGWISDTSEKAYLFQRSRVVVVPSIMARDGETEGGPMVVIEALSAGRPVIVSAGIGSSKAWIENGVNGYVVPEKDPQALQQAITQVLESDQFSEEQVLATFARWQGFSYQVAVMTKAIGYATRNSRNAPLV